MLVRQHAIPPMIPKRPRVRSTIVRIIKENKGSVFPQKLVIPADRTGVIIPDSELEEMRLLCVERNVLYVLEIAAAMWLVVRWRYFVDGVGYRKEATHPLLITVLHLAVKWNGGYYNDELLRPSFICKSRTNMWAPSSEALVQYEIGMASHLNFKFPSYRGVWKSMIERDMEKARREEEREEGEIVEPVEERVDDNGSYLLTYLWENGRIDVTTAYTNILNRVQMIPQTCPHFDTNI